MRVMVLCVCVQQRLVEALQEAVLKGDPILVDTLLKDGNIHVDTQLKVICTFIV